MKTAEERKARKAEYYQRNRERILAKVKSYAEANLEKVQRSQKSWRARNGRQWDAARYDRDKEKINARTKRYYNAHREQIRAAGKAYIMQFPERYAALIAVRDAVRAGVLHPQVCWECGAEKTEAHHANYDAPLDVVWLCRRHHKQLHAEV